jgi:hypothetical protein
LAQIQRWFFSLFPEARSHRLFPINQRKLQFFVLSPKSNHVTNEISSLVGPVQMVLRNSYDYSPMEEENEDLAKHSNNKMKNNKKTLSRSLSSVVFDDHTFRFPITDAQELKDYWNAFYKQKQEQLSSQMMDFLPSASTSSDSTTSKSQKKLLLLQAELSEDV